ncbi:MAG: substrate-binding domain-containing protein [Clostridia bacterium]|nr:substrate-binding domain-containing protein [Clostridia bacterium]
MKRTFIITVALLFVLSTAACVKKPAGEQTTPKPAEESAAPATDIQATDVPATEVPVVERPQCSLAEYPRFDGSTANIPLAMGLIRFVTGCTEQEAEERSKVSTTDYAYQKLNDREADMLLVYEASKPTKETYDPENRFDMRPIGLDALVFIVNKDNPVNSLTEEQIKGIYSGKITNWKEVGGNDQQIVAFQRPELSGSQTLMLDLVMKDTEMASAEMVTISESMADVIRDIAAYDSSANAIGYSVYYYAKNMFAQPNLKFITVEGVEPTYESINAGEYPYINPFYAIIPKHDPNAMAVKIVDWLQSVEGQMLVAHCGYVPYMKGIGTR